MICDIWLGKCTRLNHICSSEFFFSSETEVGPEDCPRKRRKTMIFYVPQIGAEVEARRYQRIKLKKSSLEKWKFWTNGILESWNFWKFRSALFFCFLPTSLYPPKAFLFGSKKFPFFMGEVLNFWSVIIYVGPCPNTDSRNGEWTSIESQPVE